MAAETGATTGPRDSVPPPTTEGPWVATDPAAPRSGTVGPWG
jgi:hypothetical protein